MPRQQLCPRSPYDEVGGLMYFPRMLDKIRKHKAGSLREDFHANLGIGLDGFCCRYLHVEYEMLKERVLAGGDDQDVLNWCYQTGRPLNETEAYIWSCFARKRGWRDGESVDSAFAKYKQESGLSDRDDILTAFDFYEADEASMR